MRKVATDAKRIKEDLKKKSNGYKKLNEKHKAFIRKYVTFVLPKKKTNYEIYMEVMEWNPKFLQFDRKRKYAAVLANKILNTPGAQEYIEELQKKINDEIEEHEVIRPITEDLKLLDKVIKHNIEGIEKDDKGKETKTLYKTSKTYAAIRAIEVKSRILGENRIRVLSEGDKVDMSEEAVDSRLNMLIKKAKGE